MFKEVQSCKLLKCLEEFIKISYVVLTTQAIFSYFAGSMNFKKVLSQLLTLPPASHECLFRHVVNVWLVDVSTFSFSHTFYKLNILAMCTVGFVFASFPIYVKLSESPFSVALIHTCLNISKEYL